MADWDESANRVLKRQHQAISADQALACGAGENGIKAKLKHGLWVRLAPGVYCPAGMEGGWHQGLWVAHLAAGPASVVSHEAAAELHGLRHVRLGATTLTVPPGAHPRVRGARFTEADDFGPHHVTRLDGLPVTTPARTIVDLAGRRDVRVSRLDAILVAAHGARQTTVTEVAAVAAEVRRRGKRGMAELDTVFDKRRPGAPIPASVLEERLAEVIELAGLRGAVFQHPLPAVEPVVGFVDAALTQVKLIVEADGRRWHHQEQDMERDRERDNQAAVRGWQTMRFTHRRLVADPAGAAAQLRGAYEQRLADRYCREASEGGADA
jgi:very-short-patch-repair endonuclease